MSEAIYVPKSSAKKRDTTFGEVIKLSFKVSELGAFAKQHKNDADYLNLEIVPRKSVSDYGDTHSVKLDTWKPKADGGGQKTAQKPAASKGSSKKTTAPEPEDTGAGDDIPF